MKEKPYSFTHVHKNSPLKVKFQGIIPVFSSFFAFVIKSLIVSSSFTQIIINICYQWVVATRIDDQIQS